MTQRGFVRLSDGQRRKAVKYEVAVDPMIEKPVYRVEYKTYPDGAETFTGTGWRKAAPRLAGTFTEEAW